MRGVLASICLQGDGSDHAGQIDSAELEWKRRQAVQQGGIANQ